MKFKMIDFAIETYPGCDYDDIEFKILQDLLEKVEMTRKDADETLQKIIQIAETINEYYLILSIDEIGPNLASRILAEIGDIKRFKIGEALIPYLGLDPNINQENWMVIVYLSQRRETRDYDVYCI